MKIWPAVSRVLVLATMVAAGCTAADDTAEPTVGETTRAVDYADTGCSEMPRNLGLALWVENTYGNQDFFDWLGTPANPNDRLRIKVGFEAAIKTPRHRRFDEWGVLNDPQCKANTDPSHPDYPMDICPEAHPMDPKKGWPTGVIGLRKFPKPDGGWKYGLACAGCHSGIDPTNPPLNPNEPCWSNLNTLNGNSWLKVGKILSANMAEHDPRRVVLMAYPHGTVDTTVLQDDNIFNPGEIPPIWELGHRPMFDVHIEGSDRKTTRVHVLRHGGEDSRGATNSYTRVFTNIGMCFFYCQATATMCYDDYRGEGERICGDPSRTTFLDPINLEHGSYCRSCPEFISQPDLDKIKDWMIDHGEAPRYPHPVDDGPKYERGRALFEESCASCHSTSNLALTDGVVKPLATTDIGTNKCRALATNWEEGRVWRTYSSWEYKQAAAAGLKGYRTTELAAVWQAGALLHNKSIGVDAPIDATPEQRAAVFEANMLELMTADRPPKMITTDYMIGPWPVGTPIALIFRDPATGKPTCDDVIENRGHTYGSHLTTEQKLDLIYWLKFQ